MVCEHRQRQPAERVADTLRLQHIPGDSWRNRSFQQPPTVSGELSKKTYSVCVGVFFFFSPRSHRPCWAATSPLTTSSLWRAQGTRRPQCTKSSTERGRQCACGQQTLDYFFCLYVLFGKEWPEKTPNCFLTLRESRLVDSWASVGFLQRSFLFFFLTKSNLCSGQDISNITLKKKKSTLWTTRRWDEKQHGKAALESAQVGCGYDWVFWGGWSTALNLIVRSPKKTQCCWVFFWFGVFVCFVFQKTWISSSTRDVTTEQHLLLHVQGYLLFAGL